MAPLKIIHNVDASPERPKRTGIGGLAPFRHIGDKPLEFPEWLIKGILPLTGVALLAGQFSSGKTFIAIDLALSLIYGEDFLGRKVKSGGVLWFAAEGSGELESRVFASRREKFGDDGSDPLPFLWRDATPNGTTEAILAEIKAMIRSAKGECDEAWNDCPLRLVVVDTFAAGLAIKDENDNAEAAGIMKRLAEIGNEFGVLIMPVAHLGKAAESGVRGASAYGAGADAIIAVTADIDSQNGAVNGLRSVSLTKSRRGGTGPLASFDLAPTQIGLDHDREPVMSCYVSFSGSAVQPKGKPLTRGLRCFYESLDEALAIYGIQHKVRGDGPTVRAVTASKVRDEFMRRYLVGDTEGASSKGRTAWKRAFDEAERTRKIAGEHFNEDNELIWRT